jgi:hypothetical protein
MFGYTNGIGAARIGQFDSSDRACIHIDVLVACAGLLDEFQIPCHRDNICGDLLLKSVIPQHHVSL